MHKFIYENAYDEYEPRKITIEVGQDASLTEMLESFVYYLKACGYSIPESDYLDFVNDNYESESVTDDWNPRDMQSPYGNITVTYNGVKFNEHE